MKSIKNFPGNQKSCIHTCMPRNPDLHRHGSIRMLVEGEHWNVVLHLCPNIKWLDEQAARNLGEKYIKHCHRHLYGNDPAKHSGIFTLVMETSPRDDLWHFHGFARIDSKWRRRDLLKNGKRWFTSTTNNFFASGGVKAPDYMRVAGVGETRKFDSSRIAPSAIVEVLREETDPVSYATKHWSWDGKEELVLIGGPSKPPPPESFVA